MAQAVVIVEVLVAQGQTILALAYQARQVVRTTGLAAWIVNRLGHRLAQSKPAIRLLQQQYTAIARDIASLESGFDPAAFTGWKVK